MSEEVLEEVEETEVEEEVLESKDIRLLRRQAKEGKKAREELAALKLERAFEKAGIDPTKGTGKLLAQVYKGEPDVEAVKAFVKEEGLEDAITPATQGAYEPTPEELARKEQVEQVKRLREAGTTIEPTTVQEQIQAAEAKQDWQTAIALKNQQLIGLFEKQNS